MITNNRLRRESKHYAFEIALVLASVLIFRSAWILMDDIPSFNTPTSLVIMLILGIAVSVVIFDRLFEHEREHKKNR